MFEGTNAVSAAPNMNKVRFSMNLEVLSSPVALSPASAEHQQKSCLKQTAVPSASSAGIPLPDAAVHTTTKRGVELEPSTPAPLHKKKRAEPVAAAATIPVDQDVSIPADASAAENSNNSSPSMTGAEDVLYEDIFNHLSPVSPVYVPLDYDESEAAAVSASVAAAPIPAPASRAPTVPVAPESACAAPIGAQAPVIAAASPSPSSDASSLPSFPWMQWDDNHWEPLPDGYAILPSVASAMKRTGYMYPWHTKVEWDEGHKRFCPAPRLGDDDLDRFTVHNYWRPDTDWWPAPNDCPGQSTAERYEFQRNRKSFWDMLHKRRRDAARKESRRSSIGIKPEAAPGASGHASADADGDAPERRKEHAELLQKLADSVKTIAVLQGEKEALERSSDREIKSLIKKVEKLEASLSLATDKAVRATAAEKMHEQNSRRLRTELDSKINILESLESENKVLTTHRDRLEKDLLSLNEKILLQKKTMSAALLAGEAAETVKNEFAAKEAAIKEENTALKLRVALAEKEVETTKDFLNRVCSQQNK